jgi:hypothetical protein
MSLARPCYHPHANSSQTQCYSIKSNNNTTLTLALLDDL